MDILTRIHQTQFLGREFLTWLWFRSDTREGRFTTSAGDIELWFDQRLKLESEASEASTIQAETPTATQEARVSALTGKSVTQAKIRIVAGQKQWTFTIRQSLALSGVKIPGLLSREDDDQFFERLFLIEEIESLVRELYDEFIRIRVNDATWSDELAEIRRWIRRPEAA